MKSSSPDFSQTITAHAPAESLSALADGEVQALDAALRVWRDDDRARADWHAYHLIGDVMRSDELASTPQRDAAFLAAFRERLAKEPVVLAPATVSAPAVHGVNWRLPMAVAAGFVAVAGVLLVARMGSSGNGERATELAAASSPGATTAVVLRQSAIGEQAVIVDPRLEEFLRAHQAAGGSVAAAAPGGTLRRVEVIVPAEAPR